VTLVETSPLGIKFEERRRHERVELCLRGWYMLRNRHESPCWTINLSPGSLTLLGLEKGMVGERVIANFDHLGWLEGTVTRNFDKCFALALQLTSSKRDKLARTLTWLHGQRTRGISDRREHERVRPYRRRVPLATEAGHKHQAALIDASILGAALNTDAVPPLGSRVTIGRTSARVVRHFETGIAVRFDEELSVQLLKEGAV
jgi:hypothetical protein